ncbi:MAG: NAD(P)H-dependent oxidoreductase subunit E [Rhodopseudomonas palustris]|nr:NAD(P)H-dependent oxidoreductase subunit E [Rhodopseudomonas palustris]
MADIYGVVTFYTQFEAPLGRQVRREDLQQYGLPRQRVEHARSHPRGDAGDTPWRDRCSGHLLT